MRAALIAVVVLVGCKDKSNEVMDELAKSKIALAEMQVKQFADEAFFMWARNDPSKACPDALTDLVRYTNRQPGDIADPWGTPIKMVCPPPPGAKGIGVVSAGADKKFDTADDIKSF